MQPAAGIRGYQFPAELARRIVGHNRRAVMGNNYKGEAPAIGTAFISVPRLCNLRCPYCYTDSGNDAAVGLSDDEIEGVVAFVAGMGAQSVVVAGEGEPFLTSRVWKIIEAAARHGLMCVVFTNGTLITPNVARRLLTSPVSIILKLHSFRPSIQDELVGIEGAHKSIYAGLDALLSAGFRAPRLALQSAIMKPILDDLRDVFVFCRVNNIVPYIETFVAMGRGAKPSVRGDLEPTPSEVKRFFTEAQELDRKRFGIRWPAAAKARVVAYGACNKSQIAITIKPNGDVFRCITESTRLGNMRQSSFRDIMLSDRVRHALVEPSCSGCASLSLRCSTPR